MGHTGSNEDKQRNDKDNSEQTPRKELRQPDTGRGAGYDNDKKSARCISNEENFRKQAAGTTPGSPATNDDSSNSRGLADGDSDAEYERSRLLPEHYVAPRRQRRLPNSTRARLASVRTRRLAFNGYDGESKNQEVTAEGSDLQMSDEVSSPSAQSFNPEPRPLYQNTRRQLFGNDNNSLGKSFYTITQPHNNSRLSNHFNVATIQLILDTVFGSTCSDNSCPKQPRPHNTSFSDDNEDLGSSDEDCNDANASSDNDSADLSSEEEYVGSTAESVYFLPKSQLSLCDSDLHSSSLCPVANENIDNLGYCAVEISDTDDDNLTLDNSADEGCNNLHDSEEETFTFLISSEENSRSPTAGTPPFSPVTNDNRSSLRAEEDSEAEYNRQRCRLVQCAAPRRQRRLAASRRSRPSPLARRRLCFDDSDDESKNQRAMSEDTSGVSELDASDRTSLFSPSNKYLYALVPPHDYIRQSRQVDIASILSILNGVFNPPSCDNRSSSQSYLSNNSCSEHEPNHSVDQPSLATDSSRLFNNDIHDASENFKQTESPLHPPKADNSDDSLC